MAKKLTIQYLNSRLEAGRHYDSSGTGLHIHVRSSGSKSWSQKLRFRGKQIELGLGSYPSVSLAEARELAAKNKIWQQAVKTHELHGAYLLRYRRLPRSQKS